MSHPKENLLTIWGHLEELRSRLLKSLVALGVAVAVTLYYAADLIRLLTQPIGGPQVLQAIEVTENIGVYTRVALLGGFILALPFILYQVLAYILPALSPGERKWIYLSVPAATLLFTAGAAFAFFVMLPAAVTFLVGFAETPTTPRLASYIEFTTNILFWIGLSFEMPLLVFILAKLRLVTARMLSRQWRLAVVIISIVAAVISPTVDPVNMLLVMLPMIALYGLSIILAALA